MIWWRSFLFGVACGMGILWVMAWVAVKLEEKDDGK